MGPGLVFGLSNMGREAAETPALLNEVHGAGFEPAKH